MDHKEKASTKEAQKAAERESQSAPNGDQVVPDAAPADEAAVDVDKLREDVQRNLEGWQRTLAEFQNYKRRTEREARESYQNAVFDVLKSMLPIVDDFERAMANVPEPLQRDGWIHGVTLIHRKFAQLLDEYNVESVDPLGQPFDPNRHQAIGTDEDSDVEKGHVSTVLQKGYVAGDQVLRPAIVKVAS